MTVGGSAHVTVRWELAEMYCFGGSYVPVYDCKACGNRAYGLSFHEMIGHLSAIHNDPNPTEAMRKAMFVIAPSPANVPALDSATEAQKGE